MAICPSCGEENPDRFRLCGFCGTPLRSAEPAREIRKTVTIVFSDLVGSTAIGERLDSESLRAVMSRYFDVMRAELERHGGTVEKFIGDAVMAVFGVPHLHEDDAERAVRAAAAMQAALAGLNAEMEARFGVTLANRTGVNTGEVVAGDPSAGQRLVTGDAVNVAARLEQAAGRNEVLIGPLTRELVAPITDLDPVEPLELKGKSEPMPAFRLIGVRATAAVRAPAAPLVGRAEELATLRAELAAVADSGSARLVTIEAVAGAGKSRLVSEFLETVPEGTTVTRGRCLSYGQGITFWPVAEALRELAGVLDDDPHDAARAKLDALAGGDQAAAERAAAAVGLTDAAYPVDELFWGLRRVLARIAASGPLVVAFEDLHWAEPTMLDLVEHLAATPAPVLLVCTTRDEISGEGDGWAATAGGTLIELDRLSTTEAAQLAAGIAGASVSPQILRTIVETAGGNPLFLEQMLAMLQEAPGGDIAVPPTISALLAARLDRLGNAQRDVVGTASVVGQVFPQAAVVELVPDTRRAEVPDDLGGLERRRLLQPHPAVMTTGPAFAFQHILIRDAAYASLLKRDRAQLHERFVAWADAVNGDRASEYEEILGYHLEQAHGYLSELGPLDDRGRSIGRQASERLQAAGRRAFARGDMPAAANLMHRAAALLPAFDQKRLDLLPDLGEALMDVGEFAEAQRVLREAIAASDEAGDHRLRADAALGLALVEFYGDPLTDWSQRAARIARGAIPVFELMGDDAGLAKAWRVLGTVHATALRYGEAAEAVARAAEHARAAGDLRQERRNASSFAVAAVYGPTPVPEAIAECSRIAADATGDRRTEGLVLGALAHLEAMRGEFDRARELSARARSILEELGNSVLAASTSLEAGAVELLAGDPAEAERLIRRDVAELERMGAAYLLSTTTALLAQAVAAQGRDAEAAELVEAGQRVTGDEDVDSAVLLACVRSGLLVRGGDVAAGAAEARRANALLDGADAPVIRAEALLALADACDAAGDTAAASAARTRAAAECRAKGYLVAVERSAQTA
ncbi:MAG TPA: AAA family ATPase [Gaiellales bacterium]|nr:AAA family ATPase [Gaiellales bacterium]